MRPVRGAAGRRRTALDPQIGRPGGSVSPGRLTGRGGADVLASWCRGGRGSGWGAGGWGGRAAAVLPVGAAAVLPVGAAAVLPVGAAAVLPVGAAAVLPVGAAAVLP